jgi:alpha-glucosidase
MPTVAPRPRPLSSACAAWAAIRQNTRALLLPILAATLPAAACTGRAPCPAAKATAAALPTLPVASAFDVPCALEANTRSRAHPQGVKTELRLTNGTAANLFFHWIDTEGKRRRYGTLAPGASQLQSTFEGYAWVVTDVIGQCVALAVASTEPREIRVNALLPPTADSMGSVTGFSAPRGGAPYVVEAGAAKVRIAFLRPDVFRLWMAPDGAFHDLDGHDVVRTDGFGPVDTTSGDAGDYYWIASSAVRLRVYKSPLTFALYRADDVTLVWRESRGLASDANETSQRLAAQPGEQFYGGGLSLGDWAHRGQTVPIAIDNEWREGSNASPVPFYMSTVGYGVVRNTWAPGSYDFGSVVRTSHREARFDAFYMVADDLKGILGRYTELTGRPFLAPIYGFELGNADCFSTGDTDPKVGPRGRAGHLVTSDVLQYAQAARAMDMPSGWFLPNDGYGCGYEDLPHVVDALRQAGFETGLWTSTGLKGASVEVGTVGTRIIKTDVAWVGDGYLAADSAVHEAVSAIEGNSDARRFVWTVDGWAGTQSLAVVWTGDTNGTWEDMRWHVPSLAGAGLSGLNYAAGDVDGIYRGDSLTYVRDIEWKIFTPVLMTMSGWGPVHPRAGYRDKEPWTYEEPFRSIVRKYLKLRMRLVPYLYTMSHIAHETGVPSTRALVLEFPDDPVARGNETRQEFMAGDAFLVAPVTADTSERDGIYLPSGVWIDYWTNHVYRGPITVDHYPAPLDTLPLFVRAGAVIPMWPSMLHYREKAKTPLTLDVYPAGTSHFDLYEDDGATREFEHGRSGTQRIDVESGATGMGDITVRIGASVGDWNGKPREREYELRIHLRKAPVSVSLDGKALFRLSSSSELAKGGGASYAIEGSPSEGPVALIRTGKRPMAGACDVRLVGASTVLGGEVTRRSVR